MSVEKVRTVDEIDLCKQLRETFGYTDFRNHQLEVMKHILRGQDAIVIMPTGAGKSLCYQLPALFKEGTVIVISPLIALMKDQIDRLRKVNVSAYFLNSTLRRKEIKQIKDKTRAGEVKLLYIAPESFKNDENIEFFKQIKIAFVAIDEAHCISEWGHDFRPEYRQIRNILNRVQETPIVAVTATATVRVQLDIQKCLDIEQASVFKSSFNRENLFYEVQPKQNIEQQLIGFIKKRTGESGIVYCSTRKSVEEVTALLVRNNIRAAAYHAGMDAAQRATHQEAFLTEKIELIVATIAFGMGVDKSNVRYVIHHNMSKSLESYYQETGRAGRDGKPAHCLAFFNYNDLQRIKKFNKSKPSTERENIKYLLDEVSAYVELPICRRKQLLNYFGEIYPKDNCENCDNCVRPTTTFDGEEKLSKLLKLVSDIQLTDTSKHLLDILVGYLGGTTEKCGHDKLKVFGTGKEEGRVFWSSMLRQAIYKGFVQRSWEKVNLRENLTLTNKGLKFLDAPYSITFSTPHIYSERSSTEQSWHNSKRAAPPTEADHALLSQLTTLRKEMAEKLGVPSYVIFQTHSLEEMSKLYPTSEEEILNIQGVGKGKAEKFAEPFLKVIRAYINAHDIETHPDILVKSEGIRSKLKIRIIQYIDKRVDFDEIAHALSIPYMQLIEEIENICYSGTKLNIDYYINRQLERTQQEEIYEYFMQYGTENLSHAFEDLEGYTEEEVRLVHIKFFSDLAN